MKLKVLVPDRVLVDREVSRITAWSNDGSFCLLPRHIDYVSALSPGLFSFEVDDEYAEFLAIDEGVLVKQGFEGRDDLIGGSLACPHGFENVLGDPAGDGVVGQEVQHCRVHGIWSGDRRTLVCKNVCKVGVTKGVKAAADFHTQCELFRRSPTQLVAGLRPTARTSSSVSA